METTVTCVLCNSLGSNDGKSVPNTDEAKKNHARVHFKQSKIFDGGITEDEISQRCFVIRQPKVERTRLSQKECRRSLVDLCKSLLEHQPKSITAVCNLCRAMIDIKDKRCMLNHACAHLEIKLFECRHCNRSSSNISDVLQHIRQAHNIFKPSHEDFTDKTVDQFNEISNRIKRCFSMDYPTLSGGQLQFVVNNRRDKSQRTILHLCRSIFIQRSNPANLECNLCGSRISLVECSQPHRFRAFQMVQHAAAHLEVKLFKCRHCNQSKSTKSNMKDHLRRIHQIKDGKNEDYEDQSEIFRGEHLNAIERCFCVDQVKLEGPPVNGKRSTKGEANIRSQTPGSALAVERRLLSSRLVRKLVDSDGTIKCSLCSNQVVVKDSSGRTFGKVALFHAETHVQKPLYRCNVCGSTFSTRPTVNYHLKSKHALGLEKNHECVADEFHEEIMSVLRNCYPAEGL